MKEMFRKTVWKTLFSNKARFLANFIIVAITLIVAGGLGEMPSSYKTSYLHNYDGRAVPDLIVKSSTGSFTDEQKTSLQSLDGLDGYDEVTVFDLQQNDESYTRLYIMDIDNLQIGNLTLQEGEAPSDTTYIYSTLGFTNLKSYEVGKTVNIAYNQFLLESLDSVIEGLSLTETLTGIIENFLSSAIENMDEVTYTVSGILDDTLYNSGQKERALLEGDEEKYINRIFYLDRNTIASASETILSSWISSPSSIFSATSQDIVILFLGQIPTTDIHLRFSTNDEYFSTEYKEFAEAKSQEVSSLLGSETATILTLEENTSYALFSNYNQKVTQIVLFIPFIFLIVAALMSALTISRLIKDERSQIATLLSLGISRWMIVTKYLFFTFLSVGLGALFGYFVGTPLIPTIILPAYSAVFQMGAMPINFLNYYALGFLIASIIIGFALTLYQSSKYVRKVPASLFQEEAPKPGKTIWLEKIKFIWKPLPFRFKSSLRNIFRQWRNSLLTAVSIMLSTTLIFFGFALWDASNAMKSDSIYSNIASSMGLISTAIVILALALGITVIYSLTNMNIEDRHRELATLKVLGYHSRECSMYTFREIIIISVFSSLIALPLSAALVWWLFDYLDFGSIQDVTFWTYLFSFLIVIVLTYVTNLLLFHRIKAIDMNTSLKSLD